MSRSRKKTPFLTVGAGKMKPWKSRADKHLRKVKDGEIASGATYKKFSDVWDSPSDGKMYIPDWKKWYRK